GRKPFSRLREKVPGGRMRARERSEALLLTLLFGVRRARAARCARALIRRCAPPSPASQEKGWSRTSRRAMGRKPISRLREKVPGGRVRGRERSAGLVLPLLVGAR